MKKLLMILTLVIGISAQDIAQETKNLVVLDPASIEIIYLLGAEDSIKGIATLQQSSIYPEEKTKSLPSVGSFSNPSLEKIIALKPDLVILSSYSLNLEEQLQKLGINTLYLKADKLDDISANVTKLGEILHKQTKAQEINADFSKRLENIKKQPLHKKAVFLFATNPLSAFGKETMIHDIMELIGLHVITGTNDATRPVLSQEYILEQNPDVILFGIRISDKVEIFKDNAILKHTNAYKNNALLAIQPYPLLRASPLLADKIQELHDTISKAF